MTHKEFANLIKPFINEELDIKTLAEFLEHLDTCNECHEELEILFLVEKTLIDLESDHESYNFDQLLKDFIKKNENTVYKNIRYRFFINTLYGTSAIMSIITAIFFFAGFLFT